MCYISGHLVLRYIGTALSSIVYRSKDSIYVIAISVKEYNNNCTNSCYLDTVGHSQDSKIECLNKYPINLN